MLRAKYTDLLAPVAISTLARRHPLISGLSDGSIKPQIEGRADGVHVVKCGVLQHMAAIEVWAIGNCTITITASDGTSHQSICGMMA
eukprot:scaffold106773_cov23-Prasinocladus_malaysianus.AAC.1